MYAFFFSRFTETDVFHIQVRFHLIIINSLFPHLNFFQFSSIHTSDGAYNSII